MGKNYYLKDKDILDQALEHSWGKSAEAKAKEKAYNREYYQRHKEEILRKARQAGEGIQRTAQNAYDYGRKLANDARTSQNMRGHVQKERFVDAAGRMGSKFLRKSADYFKTHGDNEYYDKAMRTARDYSRLRSGTAQAINEADKLARQNSPVERVKRDLRRTTAGARADVENAVNNVKNELSTATSNARVQSSNKLSRNDIERYRQANVMNDRLLGDAKNRFSNAENRVQESNARAERLRKASDSERRKYDSEVERAKALRSDPRTSQLAVDARTEADVHLNKAAEYQKMAREAGQETYNRLNESNRAYKNQRRMANRRASSGAALNEASKAAARDDGGVYDKRFDSKLARDAQNAYSKLRNPKEMARRAGESARDYIDTATGKKGRRGAGVGQEVADKLSRQAKDQRSRANRFRDSARKSVQRSNSSYQQYQELRDNPNTKGYAPQAYDNAVNEAHRAIEYAGQYAKNAKRSAASAAAANAASNAANRPGYDTRYDSSIVRGVQNTKAKARGAMSKAEKAAQQAREEAKRRMKKWFNR